MSQPLAEVEFIAFDLETTGLHPVTNQIVEIGAVRFCGDGQVLETFQQLVDPGFDIPHDATRGRGITNRMVRGMPRVDQVLPRFIEFVGEAEFVPTNAGLWALLVGQASLAIVAVANAFCQLSLTTRTCESPP